LRATDQYPKFVFPKVKLLKVKIPNVKIPNANFPNAIRLKIPKIEIRHFGLPGNFQKCPNYFKISNLDVFNMLGG